MIIALLYGFKHQRHTAIFAILAAPYLTESLSQFFERLKFDEIIKSDHAYLTLNILLGVIISYQVYFTTKKYSQAGFNIIVHPGIYPLYAVHFLKENQIKGNILLPFEWGGA